MANNRIRLVNSLNLLPQVGSVVNTAGDIAYNGTTNQFEFYDGAVETLVGASTTTVFTNKVISATTNTITNLTNTNLNGSAAISNSNLAAMPTFTIKGNNTGSSATPSDLTVAQVNAILPVFTSSLNGLAPFSGGGTANYLRADGTWDVPPGATNGTVTSVSVVTANGFSGTVANPTTTPAITLTGTLSGDVTGTLTATTITATTNSTITTLSSLSLPGTQVTGNISGNAASITGVLPIANGGTDNGALSVVAGGVLYTDGTKFENVGAGTSGQFLKSNGSSAPTWGSGSFSPIAPTIQTFTSGTSLTYTRPTSPTPLYIKVRMVGGGGGGGGSNLSGTTGASGTSTIFGGSLVANGGIGGDGGGSAGSGGAGGTASVTAGPTVIQLAALQGGGGQAGLNETSFASGYVVYACGGMGGSSAFGGGGFSYSVGGASGNGAANTGGGGAGAGLSSPVTAGSGGGSGGYVEAIITSPISTYTYTVGTGGSGGGGAGGITGGTGGTGCIIIEEHYQ